MHIQILNFHLSGMSDADWRAHADEAAPIFAEVPGLISKVWLANPTTNTYGAVYTWASREAMDEYAKSDLFKAVATNPGLAGVTSTDFDVIEEPTGVTRGLAGVPA
jgi:heme-degrading monooxygenase HmoA